MKIGSHVGMSGKEMFLGSVKEALSYGGYIDGLYRCTAEYKAQSDRGTPGGGGLESDEREGNG